MDRRRRVRLVCAMAAALVLSVVAAAGAPAGAAAIRVQAPALVFAGQRIGIEATVTPKDARCGLTIRYVGGRVQRLVEQTAQGGRLVWTVRVPSVPAGRAVAKITCKGAGSASASMMVRVALQAPKITIERSGFTQRPLRYSPGSDVSYGLIIRNHRTNLDATNVSVLVNFVDPTNRVLGSAREVILRLPANTTIPYGGQQYIPVKDAVTRLEVIVGATSAQRLPGAPLLVSDMVIAQRTYEPYVDSVRGQVLNPRNKTMLSGLVGVVILDAENNIIGGGGGYSSGPLAYGARQAFSVVGDFSAIPFERAVAAMAAVIPTYTN
jgi:hypothetical protein